ncbi:bacterial transcriptional activator domain-containing protein [Actinoplanes sp. LDG1-06]|uniref:Bacterial transcriptional activator domain-containing protein n=1 Tax=Paractinoplanes ovalisporus TaxID=2810368 RepID=A0ABS2ALM1_9ACTN|nr:bacterial transcriptional activator domain-containing protein [Actinoplanes ovalisporus]
MDQRPLRESAQRALAQAHLAAGNVADARRTYDEYRSRLRRELGCGAEPRVHRAGLRGRVGSGSPW